MNVFQSATVATFAIGGLLCSSQASASLFITEFLANPAALTDAEGEYFEVFNTGPEIAVSSLTITDDGFNSFSFTDSELVIGTNEFFVFGISNQPYVDAVYTNFQLANGDDEIVVLQGSIELARVEYADGDPFGAGVAAVLNDISLASPEFVAEVAGFETLLIDDIGSPGIAGTTVIPEPASLALVALGGVALMGRRRTA